MEIIPTFWSPLVTDPDLRSLSDYNCVNGLENNSQQTPCQNFKRLSRNGFSNGVFCKLLPRPFDKLHMTRDQGQWPGVKSICSSFEECRSTYVDQCRIIFRSGMQRDIHIRSGNKNQATMITVWTIPLEILRGMQWKKICWEGSEFFFHRTHPQDHKWNSPKS